MCCSVVYFCRTADVIVISQNSFLLSQTAARLLKDKLSPIDWTKLGTYFWLISALIITIPTFSNLISYQLSWFEQVVAWFVVIFGINTTNDILKLLYVISRAFRRVKFKQFWNITSGIYAKYHVQIMLLIVYTTTHKRFVIFTCGYFKLSWNTIALSRSNWINFSCSSIN